ncbi:MAG: hypothetical protein HKM04_04510, partial [Legionellales bacterium]|nr:hypothetical protein [Legionellales bacterium]
LHNGESALHLAIKKRNNQIVQLLLQKKVNLNLKNAFNKTAFQTAIETNEIIIINSFLSHEEVSLSIHQANELLNHGDNVSQNQFVAKIIKKSCKNGKQFASLLTMNNKSLEIYGSLINSLFKDSQLNFSLSYVAEIISSLNKNQNKLFIAIFEPKFNLFGGDWLRLQSQLPQNQQTIINPYISIKPEDTPITQVNLVSECCSEDNAKYKKLKKEYLQMCNSHPLNFDREAQKFIVKGLAAAAFDLAGKFYQKEGNIDEVIKYFKITLESQYLTEGIKMLSLKYVAELLRKQKKYLEAVEYYELVGDKAPKAWTLIAQIYEAGSLGETNYEQVFNYYKKAAEGGDAEGQYCFAKIHSPDIQNKEKSFLKYNDVKLYDYWLKKSAAQGHIPAMYMLATLYVLGDFIAVDFSIAFSLFKKIAELDPNDEKNINFLEEIFLSYYQLAVSYYHGRGCDVNVELAIVYFKKAAENYSVHSAYLVGCIFLVLANEINYEHYAEGLKWLEKAANENHIDAMLKLI